MIRAGPRRPVHAGKKKKKKKRHAIKRCRFHCQLCPGIRIGHWSAALASAPGLFAHR